MNTIEKFISSMHKNSTDLFHSLGRGKEKSSKIFVRQYYLIPTDVQEVKEKSSRIYGDGERIAVKKITVIK